MGPIVKAVTEACFLIEEFGDGSDEFWKHRITRTYLKWAFFNNRSARDWSILHDKTQFRRKFFKKSGKFYA